MPKPKSGMVSNNKSSQSTTKANKTVENSLSIASFLDTVKDSKMKAECDTLLNIFTDATGFPPKMWGSSIVGFGTYHYVYDSGREGDWMMVGFSPRAAGISLYFTSPTALREELQKKLGKHKEGKGCLVIKSLSDIDTHILKEMISENVKMHKDSLK